MADVGWRRQGRKDATGHYTKGNYTMGSRSDAYREAAARAVEFQLGYQQPDGGYVWDGYAADAFHKQPYSWGSNGRSGQAHRLLDWIRNDRLEERGVLAGYRLDTYKYAWLIQGAHRLGRFDVSIPLFEAASRNQTPCGGLVHAPTERHCRVLPSCWYGVAALYLGKVEIAERVQAWASSVFAQQPSETCFYYQTTRAGQLVDQDLDPDGAACIDFGKKEQCYWELGLPLQLTCRLYMATGQGHYLEEARRFFECHEHCGSDGYTSTSSGKSALGAGLFYLLSGSPEARRRVLEFGDFLLDTQCKEGGWHNPAWPDRILNYIDAASEFSVWLAEIAGILDVRPE
jgi:hypothetical protein